jgi:hypothetical protein
MLSKLLVFLHATFSEQGTPSYARVISGFIAFMVCVWVSYIVYKTTALPDLSGAALLTGAAYGLNQVKGVVTAFKAPNGNGTPPPTPDVHPQD